MKLTIVPGTPLRGVAAVPGDKSLSHRAVLFAAMADGVSRIENFLVSGVTRVMLDALSALGVGWKLDGDVLTVHGRGFGGLRSPAQPLNCGNSATTIRLLAGALAAAGIPAVLDGSPGLRRRPMGRIVGPLQRMGVPVEASPEGTAPLALRQRQSGQKLRALVETLPVASAQVKSCLLLAALAADGQTVLREPGPSRDHTERMLGSMGVKITSREIEVESLATRHVYETTLEPPPVALQPLHLALPGDISAASFLIVAASITPGSEISIPGVGLNPTRTGLIDALRAMGADIQVRNESDQAGEPVGDLIVRSAGLRGTRVSGALVVRMIDEFSVFGAAAAAASGETVVRDASELRYKESDRITTLCQEMRALGVSAAEAEDGFSILGGRPEGGQAQSHGDHRLAMAMLVAGLAARGTVTVEGAEMIDESFPGFVDTLRSLGASVQEGTGLPA
jgi:3-phosphoshikimate 1-carboxyvinyltransferase